ncbi:hypothetical protein K8I28_16815, partial [bacterium]|nr:hypothetical protein [bacterium]
PISGDNFKLNLNVKMELSGKVEYKVLQKEEPETPVLQSELMTNLFINRLARKARSKLEAEMKKDTTLYENQLQYQDDFFEFELEPLEFSKRPVNLEDSKEVYTALDSIDYFSDPEIIKLELYHVVYDSLIKAWTNWDKTQAILAKMNVSEEYSVTKIDTIGVSIKPPFEKDFELKADNLLGKIFSVGPVNHPGTITNNDLSWSEKK